MAVLVAFVAALIFTLAVVPIAKKWARRLGLVDKPDENRKLHDQAIPLVGGLVIFVAVLVSLALTFGIFRNQFGFDWRLYGLLLGCAFILFVGVLDDRFELRGRQKLLGQFIAATILIAFGFQFEQISILGTQFKLDIFSIIFVYAWLLIGINSVNLLDGADGFATTIGLMMSGALCVISLVLSPGLSLNAVITAAAAGALLGFLRYNFPPASVYLGDAGSMMIGLFISAMAIQSSSKQFTVWAFVAPIALLSIPMFDTMAAIIRRQLTGRSIYTVDRGHLHHALLRKGFGPRKALLLFFAMCLMTATGGTLSMIHRQAEYALASIAAVIIFLMVGRVFGFGELRLVINKVNGFLRSFLILPKHRRSHQIAVRLQGERDWELCWQVLREFAEKSNLLQLNMNLNLPWLHENFHAKFHQPDKKISPDDQWTAEFPLLVGDRTIGRIVLVGIVGEVSFYDTIGELADVLASLQPYLEQTIKSHDASELVAETPADQTAEAQVVSSTQPAQGSHMLDVG